ncbi:MAG: SPASM domain-containing protein [Methylococcales bacterium]|jgi:radical SAM protein with 4Fe4S-binding SPASM domain|nr:SPASM domain-containing protein [Methylococcales bacterium]
MNFEDFKTSLHSIADIFQRYKLDGGHLTIQYVGGEILTLPQKEFENCVHFARQFFSNSFSQIIDGVQTNLIGSNQRIDQLIDLFGKRIGTSVDHFSNARTLAGNPDKYRNSFQTQHQRISKQGQSIPAIVVVDNQTIDKLEHEILIANHNHYNLTLRIAFPGGKPINNTNLEKLQNKYGQLFDEWIMQQQITIEPFFHLLVQRLSTHHQHHTLNRQTSGCPFQNDCAKRSLNLEPNGDLYLCLDMADSGLVPLGNTLRNEFDHSQWRYLQSRSWKIDSVCKQCDYFEACQGGCMAESLWHHQTINTRSEFCLIWKELFKRIDRSIDHFGIKNISHWVNTLQT